jgi:hypothetical protein
MRNILIGSSAFIKIEWGEGILERTGWQPLITNADLIRDRGEPTVTASAAAVVEGAPSQKKIEMKGGLILRSVGASIRDIELKESTSMRSPPKRRPLQVQPL